jgi:hydroxymethylpyrimidine/phosphomethylpyrimidine kinase
VPADRDTVLVIGGSDCSGGAGIARDLRTLSDHSMHGVAVVTAVTAQTHAEVRGVHLVPPEFIGDQITAALASNAVRAIKIGMLGTARAVEAVAAHLPRNGMPIVLDPVLAASSGGCLLDDSGKAALVERLLPLATLITPNVPEAALLLGAPVTTDPAALTRYGIELLKLGPAAVLVKGGHGEGDEAIDLLMSTAGDAVTLSGPRLPGTLRGTGCALASAIAVGLASERSLNMACREAKRYVAGLFESAIASL